MTVTLLSENLRKINFVCCSPHENGLIIAQFFRVVNSFTEKIFDYFVPDRSMRRERSVSTNSSRWDSKVSGADLQVTVNTEAVSVT